MVRRRIGRWPADGLRQFRRTGLPSSRSRRRSRAGSSSRPTRRLGPTSRCRRPTAPRSSRSGGTGRTGQSCGSRGREDPRRRSSASESGDVISSVEWPSRDQVLVQVEHADRRATLLTVNPEIPSASQIATLPTLSMHATLSADGRWAVFDAPTRADGGRAACSSSTRAAAQRWRSSTTGGTAGSRPGRLAATTCCSSATAPAAPASGASR